MSFTPFDPLEFKTSVVSSAALGALKREISNILSSYVGWFDPFCELIQNSLDSVESRLNDEKTIDPNNNYLPHINIIIDLDKNSLTVSDNGTGLDKEKFEQFLAPNFSFKSGPTRGHKGVGATYVAYGFNYLNIATKSSGFNANGILINARKWVFDHQTSSNPKVEPSTSTLKDKNFMSLDKGVSITVQFDKETHPKRLSWLSANTAEQWKKILLVKTGLGSFIPNNNIKITISVISDSKTTTEEFIGTGYPMLHTNSKKTASLTEIKREQDELYKKYGTTRQMPDKYKNLDFIYDNLDHIKINEILKHQLDEDEIYLLETYTPSLKFEYGYTAKLWTQFNKSLNVRTKIISAGIQLAANDMPQGESIAIPLQRNIGRQHQAHVIIHFNNYSPDMGRKGFHRELVDFSKKISLAIVEDEINRFRNLLKANTGQAPDLTRELRLDEWKDEIGVHETNNPLKLEHPNFFKPIEKISITSIPTREQDVIALFHQLVAGGVIRGIQTMSTNERFIYDSLYKVDFTHPKDIYIFDDEKNPLGINIDIIESVHGRITKPRVLEYKFNLDGLIEDCDSHDKNIKDIDLCVAWDSGENYSQKYGITSLLTPENNDQRQYHGITHQLTDHDNGSKVCDLIILKDLIEILNNRESEIIRQRKIYS